MDALRIWFLAGLLLHKAVWEVMKRRSGSGPVVRRAVPLKVQLVKLIKIAILLGILVQTVAPAVFPISGDPGMLRAAGFVLFTAGLAIALLGRVQLGDNWLDIETAGVKREQRVASAGIYAWIRHPIYIGDLLLLIGLELGLNSWLVLAAAVLVPVVLRQAVGEERMLRETLPGYEPYCQRTKRFIPFVA